MRKYNPFLLVILAVILTVAACGGGNETPTTQLITLNAETTQAVLATGQTVDVLGEGGSCVASLTYTNHNANGWSSMKGIIPGIDGVNELSFRDNWRLYCEDGVFVTLQQDGEDIVVTYFLPAEPAVVYVEATPEPTATSEPTATPEPTAATEPSPTPDCTNRGTTDQGSVQWTDADFGGNHHFQVVGEKVGTVSFAMPPADAEVIQNYLGVNPPSDENKYSFFVAGCPDSYEVIDLWEGGRILWTTKGGVTETARNWSRALADSPRDLQVATRQEKGKERFFALGNMWPQIDASTDTMWWVELGVVSKTEFFSGEPCADPQAVQAGIVDAGELANYVCLSPGQWARVELRKVEYDGTGPVAVVVGSFYWAPGNLEGARSTNVEPPTPPVATFIFDADAGTYDIR